MNFLRTILGIPKAIALFLFKDLPWKLLSLALAYVVWLAGMNVSDPNQNINHDIPLTLSNIELLESENIRVLNADSLRETEIRVNVRAPQSVQRDFSASGNQIEASVNFNDIIISEILAADEPTTVQLDVTVDVGAGGERMSTNPKTVSVTLDKYVRRSFDIQVQEFGEIAANHELMETKSQLAVVNIGAPQSVLNLVSSVQAIIDVSGRAASFSAPVTLSVFDSEGQDITGLVEIETPETEVAAIIYPQKEVPLSIGHTGTLAYNYVVTETIITPPTVFIVGDPTVLEAVNEIELNALDLTNHSETLNTGVDVNDSLPEGISLMSGQESSVGVVYTIEPLRPQEFLLPLQNIRMGYSSLSVRLLNSEPISVTVLGPDSLMDEMTAAQIGAQLNLTGLGVGTHSVPLNIYLPDGMATVGTPMVDVIISETPAEEPDELQGNITYDEDGNPVYTDPETGAQVVGVIDPETGLPVFSLPDDGGVVPSEETLPVETAEPDAALPSEEPVTEQPEETADGGAITGESQNAQPEDGDIQ